MIDIDFPSFEGIRQKIIKYNSSYRNEFVCPNCGKVGCWISERNMLCCKGCSKQISLKKNSKAENSRVSLETWHKGLEFFLCRDSNGLSIQEFESAIGVSHQTAANWLKLFRKNLKPANLVNMITEAIISFQQDFFTATSEKEKILAIAVDKRSIKTKYSIIQLHVINNTIQEKKKFLLAVLNKRNLHLGAVKIDIREEELGDIQLDNAKINAILSPNPIYQIKSVLNDIEEWINPNIKSNSPYYESYLQEYVFLRKRQDLNKEKMSLFIDNYLTQFMDPDL